MEIETPFITFEQAKALKEKKFDAPCKNYFEYALKSQKDKEQGYAGAFGWKKGELNTQSGYFINDNKLTDHSSEYWLMCARPEHWRVVEWLRVQHNIWISIDIIGLGYFVYSVKKMGFKNGCYIQEQKDSILYDGLFKSPAEAYAEAFNFILKELIK